MFTTASLTLRTGPDNRMWITLSDGTPGASTTLTCDFLHLTVEQGAPCTISCIAALQQRLHGDLRLRLLHEPLPATERP